MPERTAGCFYARAANFEALEPLKRRVEACFRAGAEATGEGRFRRTMVRFLQLSKRRVSDLMRPLTDVVTVPSTVSLAGALDEAARSGSFFKPS